MNFVDSFILVTAFSYFGAALLPFQFEKKADPFLQRVFYLAMFGVLFALIVLDVQVWIVWSILGAGYSILAVYCYGGGQDWGSTGHNLLMTGWDLALAVCLLSKISL
jgi:hypothetical protein